MHTMTLCTLGVFSTVRNSASVPMSMPSSASAAPVSASRRFLKAGSTQARATTLAPSAGERLSMTSTWAAIKAKRALNIVWDETEASDDSWMEMNQYARQPRASWAAGR